MKNDKEIQISKLVVRMGDKDVHLTIEQAKELSLLLNDLFNTKPTVKHEHHYHDMRKYWPYYSDTYVPRYWDKTIFGTSLDSGAYNSGAYSRNIATGGDLAQGVKASDNIMLFSLKK